MKSYNMREKTRRIYGMPSGCQKKPNVLIGLIIFLFTVHLLMVKFL
mgnify:FL=1